MVKKLYLTGLLFFVLVFPLQISAATFDHIVSFGDSLTDNGKGQGYKNTVYTDGKLWTENLADQMESSLTNYAYSGSTTRINKVFIPEHSERDKYTLDKQVTSASGNSNGSTLYTVWSGTNNFLRPVWDSLYGKPASAKEAAQDVYDSILQIETFGLGSTSGSGILVLNLPDIGLTPAFYGNSEATIWTNTYNTELLSLLDSYDKPENFFFLDVFDLFNTYLEFNDTTKAINKDKFDKLFWDDIVHPSSVGHEMIANAAFNVVVPIPSTIFLLGFGLLGLARVNRKK